MMFASISTEGMSMSYIHHFDTDNKTAVGSQWTSVSLADDQCQHGK